MNERFDRALKRARQRGFDCGLAVNPTGELLVESRMRRERDCFDRRIARRAGEMQYEQETKKGGS